MDETKATYTPNLNLEKPGRKQRYDIAVFNANYDKIDENAGELKTAVDDKLSKSLGGTVVGATTFRNRLSVNSDIAMSGDLECERGTVYGKYFELTGTQPTASMPAQQLVSFGWINRFVKPAIDKKYPMTGGRLDGGISASGDIETTGDTSGRWAHSQELPPNPADITTQCLTYPWYLRYIQPGIVQGTNKGNGWITFPNGLTLQWGTGVHWASEGSQTIQLPVAFRTECLWAGVSVWVIDDSGQDTTIHVTSKGRTFIRVFHQAFGRGLPNRQQAMWCAIGY